MFPPRIGLLIYLPNLFPERNLNISDKRWELFLPHLAIKTKKIRFRGLFSIPIFHEAESHIYAIFYADSSVYVFLIEKQWVKLKISFWHGFSIWFWWILSVDMLFSLIFFMKIPWWMNCWQCIGSTSSGLGFKILCIVGIMVSEFNYGLNY